MILAITYTVTLGELWHKPYIGRCYNCIIIYTYSIYIYCIIIILYNFIMAEEASEYNTLLDFATLTSMLYRSSSTKSICL